MGDGFLTVTKASEADWDDITGHLLQLLDRASLPTAVDEQDGDDQPAQQREQEAAGGSSSESDVEMEIKVRRQRPGAGTTRLSGMDRGTRSNLGETDSNLGVCVPGCGRSCSTRRFGRTCRPTGGRWSSCGSTGSGAW